MTTQHMQNKNSTRLITALTIVGPFLFFAVLINFYVIPVYIIVHGLLVFGLVNIKSFYSTIKPIKFGLLLCGIPFGLILIQSILTIPLYIATNSNVIEILAVTGLTLIVSVLDFAVTYYIYNKWWKSDLKNIARTANST